MDDTSAMPKDIFTAQQHSTMDAIIKRWTSLLVPKSESLAPLASASTTVPYLKLLSDVVMLANAVCGAYVFNEDPPFLSMLVEREEVRETLKADLAAMSFKATRSLGVLRMLPTEDVNHSANSLGVMTAESMLAAEAAWDTPYRGSAADALKQKMRDVVDTSGMYARSLVIAQSAGTGKSRMVDELAKEMLCVHMSLGGRESFPPFDESLDLWLREEFRGSDREKTSKVVFALLYALFTTTLRRLEELTHDGNMASALRREMAEGRAGGKHGVFHEQFFEDVIQTAKDFTATDATNARTTLAACQALCDFLEARGIGYRFTRLCICWDGSQDLYHPHGQNSWSLYTEIQRCLTNLGDLPVFFIFISTTIPQYERSPPNPPRNHPSSRIQYFSAMPVPVYTQTSFDQMAIRVSVRGTWLIEDVATVEYMSHLGRPLFGGRFEYMARVSCKDSDMVVFAAKKLLGRPLAPGILLPAESIACLSLRLGLELDGAILKVDQIRNHMHLCIQADHLGTDIASVSPSEPLLAEGAYEAMKSMSSIPSHLWYYLQDGQVKAGANGDVVAVLLIMLARDAATSLRSQVGASARIATANSEHPTLPRKHPSLTTETPLHNPRVLPLLDLLRELLPPQYYDAVRQSKATRHLPGEYRTLEDTFADAQVYFNHCIKILDRGVLNQKFLWRYVVRGAMVACAPHRWGVDLVIPVVFKGSKLMPGNTTAVLIRVRNDALCTDEADSWVFDEMDPFLLGVFAENAEPLPVIRMVFSLASPTSAVVIPATEEHSTSGSSDSGIDDERPFTAFDIWCAGCTRTTFKPIKDHIDESVYAQILGRLRNFNLMYERGGGDPDMSRVMHPAATTRGPHWNNFVD